MLAILPAGGRSKRFGSIYKELLPIGDDRYLLQQAFLRATAYGADQFLLISSEEKIITHMQFLRNHMSGVRVMVMVRQQEDEDLWSGLRPALRFDENCLLLLPDTLFQIDNPVPLDSDLAFGTFQTDTPERFSVLDIEKRKIITKQPLSSINSWPAWGCIYWSRRVTNFWRESEKRQQYATYDDAFEAAMQVFTPKTFAITDYQDLGTWDAYRTFVAG